MVQILFFSETYIILINLINICSDLWRAQEFFNGGGREKML